MTTTELKLLGNLADRWKQLAQGWEAVKASPMTEEQQLQAEARQVVYTECSNELTEALKLTL